MKRPERRARRHGLLVVIALILGGANDSWAREDPLETLLAHPCGEPWEDPIAFEDLSRWAAARLELDDGGVEIHDGQWLGRFFPDDGRKRWVAIPVLIREHYLCESDVMVSSGRILRLDVDLNGDARPEIMLSNSQTTGNGGGGFLI